MSKAELKIPANDNLIVPVEEFVQEFFKQCHKDSDKLNEFLKTFDQIINQVNHHNLTRSAKGEISILAEENIKGISLMIKNKGYPVFREMLEIPDSASGVEVFFKNEGRKGQCIEVILNSEPNPSKNLNDELIPLHSNSQTLIRELLPSESHRITKLFFSVYGYRYINEWVYFPETLTNLIESGKLKSIAAFNEHHELIGHVGLVRCGENPPVYEAAMGVVDPSYNRNGLFARIFEKVHEEIKKTPMSYCVYDFVTNHDITQKRISKYGFSDMALFLGNQVAETQASLDELGIGVDSKDMNRYSILLGIGRQTAHPFGETVILPANIGEACGFLLEPIGMKWTPASRFSALPEGGEFTVQRSQEQKSVLFDFVKPGRQALSEIIEMWHTFVREGVQYIAIDVPLNTSGIGTIYDILAPRGFFFAGFLPYHFSDQLGFRFQFLLPTRVNFSAIKIFSPHGQRLLKMVKENYERNALL